MYLSLYLYIYIHSISANNLHDAVSVCNVSGLLLATGKAHFHWKRDQPAVIQLMLWPLYILAYYLLFPSALTAACIYTHTHIVQL